MGLKMHLNLKSISSDTRTMAKEGWSSEMEEGLPEDQQIPHSGVWEDEATREAKYSRVSGGGRATSPSLRISTT